MKARAGASTVLNGWPSGPRHDTRSPGSSSYNRPVLRPARLLSTLTAVTRPPSSRMTSNTEKGRRNSGSLLRLALSITNCPGSVRVPTSGAASVSTE